MFPNVPRAVLVDLAGVLHEGPHALPGAVAALTRLRASGLPVRFLTNTTRTPRIRIVTMLRHAGFTLAEEEVFTAAHAARALIEQRGLRPHYLVHPDLDEEMGPSQPAPDAVVLGDAGPRFGYDALNTVFRLIMDGLPLIAMARNRYFKEAEGLSLDLGAFVAALEFASGCHAEITGKPNPAFFLAPLGELGVTPEETVLIGDDVTDDIAGAQACGMQGILVRTGKYRSGDEARINPAPGRVVAGFQEAVAYIVNR